MVGIIPPKSKKELEDYINFSNSFFNEYKIIKNINDITVDVKLLIFCGGADINLNKDRDLFESNIFFQFYKKIPILGICRGMQLINVLLGGTLIKDINEDIIKHTTNKLVNEKSSSIKSSFHKIYTTDKKILKVNSRHHQAVDRLGEELVLYAYSIDKIPEIVYSNDLILCQFHPEKKESRKFESTRLIIEMCKNILK